MGGVDGLDLGEFGIWSFEFERRPLAWAREALAELEEAGWGAVWVPELSGREALTHAGFLLSCTRRIPVVNGIAQIWARQARWARAGAALLAQAHPDRHVLGLGFGGAPRPGTSPVAAMAAYLDEMDADEMDAVEAAPVRRLLAAYGPRMLELARDRAAGAHTYLVDLDHTARARRALGSGAFLGVEQAVVLDPDPATARAAAREHLRPYLATPYNVAKFRRLGYTEQDLAGGGSDRLVDGLVAWGGVEAVVERLRGHLRVGADHVAVQVVVQAGDSPVAHWRGLAEALLP